MSSYYRTTIDLQRSLAHSFEQSSLLHAIDTDDVKVVDNLVFDILRKLGNQAHDQAAIEAIISELTGDEGANAIFGTLLHQQLLCPVDINNES